MTLLQDDRLIRQSEQVILSRKISVGQSLEISASEKIEIICGKSK